jgi:hypothetical protein
MTIRSRTSWAALLLVVIVACAADDAEKPRSPDTSSPVSGASGSRATTQPAGSNANASAGTGAASADAGQLPVAAGSGGSGAANQPPTAAGDCDLKGTSKPEGCPCVGSETAACWTGSAAERNTGECHDGLQICSGGSEFATWGRCMGEQKLCGTDAGTPPPPPPPDEDCACVPGSIIQCSEDCTVGIICSLTATKTCLPDGTWTPCREDLGVELDLPGVQCRNMLHGCFDILQPDMPTSTDGEIYVGDCSKQFKCGHAPPLVN